MPKRRGLIKSLFELILKPNETYPPIRPSKIHVTSLIQTQKETAMDSSTRTQPVQESKVSTSKKVTPTWENRRSENPGETAVEKQGQNDSSGSLGFAARTMSHVSIIPLSQWRMKGGHPILEYTKSDRGFNLTIQASQSYGLPFGPDRDLLYWGVAEVKKRKTRTIEFQSMRDLARQLGRSECGKGLHAVQESIMRLTER